MDLWMLVALLALAGAAAWRKRSGRSGAMESGHLLDDELIRRIETEGSLEVDEPNDLDHIREEEARFWEESAWDDPEEY